MRKIKGIWIPIEVWQDTRLCWNEKILLMEIDSFTDAKDDCFFSNAYICDLLGVAERTAKMYVKNLLDLGLITARFDGRKRFLKVEKGCKKLHGRGAKNCTAEVQKIAPIINKNNKRNNKESGCATKESARGAYSISKEQYRYNVKHDIPF